MFMLWCPLRPTSILFTRFIYRRLEIELLEFLWVFYVSKHFVLQLVPRNCLLPVDKRDFILKSVRHCHIYIISFHEFQNILKTGSLHSKTWLCFLMRAGSKHTCYVLHGRNRLVWSFHMFSFQYLSVFFRS